MSASAPLQPADTSFNQSTPPPASVDATNALLPHNTTTAATDDDIDPTSLPSLLYDDIDHPATSATTQLLTAAHNHATQQLQATITQLNQQLSATRQQLQASQQQADKYRQQCAVFARNISALYDTAVSEVRRKQEEIDRLKEWKAAQERRSRHHASGTSNNQSQYGGNGASVVGGAGEMGQSQVGLAAGVKRAHNSIHQTHVPQPPYPLSDTTRKRARVDTG